MPILEAVPLPMHTADFGKLIVEETEKWAKVVKFAGWHQARLNRPCRGHAEIYFIVPRRMPATPCPFRVDVVEKGVAIICDP